MPSTNPHEENYIRGEYERCLFDVQRSIRYHSKRQHFYESCYKLVLFVGLLSGPASIVIRETELSVTIVILIPSLIVSLLTGISLIYGLYHKAALHIDLMREFIDLERALETKRNKPTQNLIDNVKDKSLQIEAKEPPVLQVLDIVCHNELSLSKGYGQDELYQIRFHQRLLRHFFDWDPNSIQQPQ